MTTPAPPAYRTCVCGHIEPHHGKQEMAFLPYHPDCQWRGCGCPKFVAAGQAAEGVEDDDADDEIVNDNCRQCGEYHPDELRHQRARSSAEAIAP